MWDVGCHIKSNSDNMNIFSIVDWTHIEMLQIHDKFEKKKNEADVFIYNTERLERVKWVLFLCVSAD